MQPSPLHLSPFPKRSDYIITPVGYQALRKHCFLLPFGIVVTPSAFAAWLGIVSAREVHRIHPVCARRQFPDTVGTYIKYRGVNSMPVRVCFRVTSKLAPFLYAPPVMGLYISWCYPRGAAGAGHFCQPPALCHRAGADCLMACGCA